MCYLCPANLVCMFVYIPINRYHTFVPINHCQAYVPINHCQTYVPINRCQMSVCQMVFS